MSEKTSYTSSVTTKECGDFFDSGSLASSQEIDAVLSAVEYTSAETGEAFRNGEQQTIPVLSYIPDKVKRIVWQGRGYGSWAFDGRLPWPPNAENADKGTEAAFAATIVAGVNNRFGDQNTGIIVPSVPGATVGLGRLSQYQARALLDGNVVPAGEAMAAATADLIPDGIPTYLVGASASAGLVATAAPELIRRGKDVARLTLIEPVGQNKRTIAGLMFDATSTKSIETAYKELDHEVIKQGNYRKLSAREQVQSLFLGGSVLHIVGMSRGRALNSLLSQETAGLMRGIPVEIDRARFSEITRAEALKRIAERLGQNGYAVELVTYSMGAHAMAGTPVTFVNAVK